MATREDSLEAPREDRLGYRLRLAEILGSFLNSVVRWGALVLIAKYGYQVVDTLGGDTTTASIGIKFLADVRVSEAFAWALGVGGVGYGVRQRQLRRDTVERLADRQQKYEKLIDPKRSSSKLTPRGDTSPEDKV